MKNFKKILASILVTLFIFTNMMPLSAYAKGTSELYISSLKVDKTTIAYGDTMKISIKAIKPNGKFSSISVCYLDPVSSKSLEISLSYNKSNNNYEGTINTDNTMNTGEWRVSNITFENNGSYYASIYSYKYDFSPLNFTLTNNSYGDANAPILDVKSLNVDKKIVNAGDNVTLSLEAFDDKSGIKSVSINSFNTLDESKKLIMNYNPKTKKYECIISIDKNAAPGEWTVQSIELYDNANNHNIYYDWDNDLSNLFFTVKNDNYSPTPKPDTPKTDTTPPTLDTSSIKIDKQTVHIGDIVNIKFKASDNKSGIKNATLKFYSSDEINSSSTIYAKYNSATQEYEASIPIDNSFYPDIWILYLTLYDNQDNYVSYSPLSPDQDIASLFCNLELTVKEDPPYDTGITPLNSSTFINECKELKNQIIKGDLYIGEDALVTVSNSVIVTGNIYVLGSLKSYGGLSCSGTIYCTNMILGNNDILSKGQIVLNGSNSITSTKISDTPVTDIPLRIDNEPIVNLDGKIDIKGATLNIGDMYIEDKKITRDFKGTFDVKDLYVGDKSSITVKFITNFGNTITKTISINTVKADINGDGLIDMADIAILSNNYNTTSKDNSWNSKLDLNKDGIVDLYDLVLVLRKFK